MCNTTLQGAVGTPRGRIFPGQALPGLFLNQSVISSGDPLGISTLKYLSSVILFFKMCSTPKLICTTRWKSIFLYHPGNTALKELVLKQTECFISFATMAQKISGLPLLRTARIALIRMLIYRLALFCSLNLIYSKSAGSFLSRPVPKSSSLFSPTFTLKDFTLGILLKLLSATRPLPDSLAVRRSSIMTEIRESISLSLLKESFMNQVRRATFLAAKRPLKHLCP